MSAAKRRALQAYWGDIMRSWVRKIVLKFYKPSKPLDAFNEPMRYEFRNPPKDKFLRLLYSWMPIPKYELITNERMVEIPFTLQFLNLAKQQKILEFGCHASYLSLQLASLGHRVTGVDLNTYAFTHPNFTFVQGDLLVKKLPKESFDTIITISTVEHCGLGVYGDAKKEQGDVEVVTELYRLLKPKGQFVITVPFGTHGETYWYRVYDGKTLKALLGRFRIKEERYFVGMQKKSWVPITKEKLEKIDSVAKIQGVACILAIKE